MDSLGFQLKTIVQNLLLLCILLGALVPNNVGACMIAGVDSGECRDYDENVDYMPYCGKFVRYRACVPKYDRIWPNHTILTKDAWVEETRASTDEHEQWQMMGPLVG